MGLKIKNLKRRKYLIAAAVVAAIGIGGGITRALLGGTSSPVSTSDIELQRGLVGWWKFNGNAKDSTPYAHDGSLVGGAAVTAADEHGVANSALNLNGSSQYVNAGTDTALTPSNITLSAWVLTKNLNQGSGWSGIITNMSSWGTGFGLQIGQTQHIAAMVSGSYLTTSWTPSINTWYHIVATHDSSTNLNILYVNGHQENSSTHSVTYEANAKTYIGAFYTSPSLFLNGYMSDVRIYNRALSANEVTALYNEYNPGLYAGNGENGLVGWWKLNGNAKDSTPNANNGTVNSATLTADREGSSSSAYSFNGTSGYIGLSDGVYNTLSVGSISMWMNMTSRPASGNAYSLFTTASSTGANNLYGLGVYSVSGTDTRLRTGENVTATSCYVYGNTSLSPGTWYHVVVTADGSTWKLYVNGTLQTLTIQQGTNVGYFFNQVVSGIQHYDIGVLNRSTGLGGYFNGSIDDVRIYNRVLSTADVTNLYNSYNAQVSLYNAGSPGGVNLGQGLIGEWDFNGNAKDATPYADNGTASSATLTSDREGRANSAYSFNGSNAYVNVPSSSTFNVTTNFSISAWVYSSSLATMGNTDVVIRGGWWNLSFGSPGVGNIRLYDNNSNGAYTTTTYSNGVWHHLVATMSGGVTSGIKIYVDGVQQTLTTTAGGWTNVGGANAVTIGGKNNGYFSGNIDDVRIWNRPLSQAEVTALYKTYK